MSKVIRISEQSREARNIIRMVVPACTSPRRHVREALKNGGKLTLTCAHKVGKRVPA